MSKWLPRIWMLALLVLVAFAIPQCLFTDHGLFNATSQQSALDPKGMVSRDQAHTFYLILWVTLGLFVVVGGALAWVLIRFRRRKGDDPNYIPPQSHGNPLIEVGLVMLSAGVLVIIAFPTFAGIVLKERLPAGEFEEEPLVINVTGYQWWWAFEYPNEGGFYTANEIVFPVGRPVQINLQTNDVIHSFWLPKLAGKKDLMAGQTNHLWFVADEEGEYWGQCAEYCGDSHAYMLFRAHAVSPEEFRDWRHAQEDPAVRIGQNDGPADLLPTMPREEWVDAQRVEQGAQLFQQNCATCHSVNPAVQSPGPNLAHFASRSTIAAGWYENDWEVADGQVSNEYLHRWIKEPNHVKPGNFMWNGFYNFDRTTHERALVMEGLKEKGLTDSDVDTLITYLYNLK
ncbi:MAG: cytochrome c oxidase subunit II [Puniceicoccaceae bacterium 5H]|nr:MAG: cytochrome c oxidase subunit II [Puniceicoccaceae bacterium 5H]